jgi:hypothetical protein
MGNLRIIRAGETFHYPEVEVVLYDPPHERMVLSADDVEVVVLRGAWVITLIDPKITDLTS